MVVPVPAHISKLPTRLPVAARRRPLLTTHSLYLPLRALNSFASYHIPATPAVSCDYALFCTTALRYPSYFQWLPHSFYRHGGVPSVPSVLRSRRSLCCAFSHFPVPKHANSLVCIDLPPLSPLFAPFSASVSFVFNRLQPLFRKHPGGGIYPSSQRQRGIKRQEVST